MEDNPKQNNEAKNQLKVKTIIFLNMEDDLKKIKQLKTIKSKNDDFGTAPGNLVYT